MPDVVSARPADNREQRVSHPLVELTLARFREFLREPEALFWVFAFPVILTLALGIAFRAQEPPPVVVGVVGDGVARQDGQAAFDALTRAPGVRVQWVDAAAMDVELRN